MSDDLFMPPGWTRAVEGKSVALYHHKRLVRRVRFADVSEDEARARSLLWSMVAGTAPIAPPGATDSDVRVQDAARAQHAVGEVSR